MSKYTSEVRFICEQKAGLKESVGAEKIDGVISASWDKIFTTKCEFFDEAYRKTLCCKIIKHYYLREIGSETVGIWLLWMNTRLEEIMPYYNQLYSSALLKFDPFNDVNITRKHNEKNSTNANTDHVGKFSDTPQGGLDGILSDKYLTTADVDNSTSKVDGTTNYDEIVTGKQGTASYSKLLQEFRKTMLNIDKQVIEEFSDLFMLVW